MDERYVERTAEDYKPAIPTTVEGVLYAAGGFATLYLVLGLFGKIFLKRRRRLA